MTSDLWRESPRKVSLEPRGPGPYHPTKSWLDASKHCKMHSRTDRQSFFFLIIQIDKLFLTLFPYKITKRDNIYIFKILYPPSNIYDINICLFVYLYIYLFSYLYMHSFIFAFAPFWCNFSINLLDFLYWCLKCLLKPTQNDTKHCTTNIVYF